MMENQVKKMGGECVRREDNFGKGGRNSGSGGTVEILWG